jgi:hypothetical protein|uniref:Uncharacterized protein n=1 Tax=viral metagenome TaxID=1070528 RepID=A0A6C0I7E6_9ZZZZ
MDNITCNYCDTKISRQNLSRHQKSDFCIKVQNVIKKYNAEIVSLNNKMILYENKIYQLEKDIEISNKLSEDYKNIIEKAATKTTIKKTYNHNNYLNYISSEPLKISEFTNQLQHIVNCDTVMYDDNDFHDHIVDNILKDKSGKDKVLCTDINRKNFTYKDENSGELISDPELERLREQLKKGTNIRQIRKDLLDKLVTEYEENGCVGVDPYKQFSDIIQKLNFGSPFVDHVAKKTYVKSKNGNELKLNNNELEYNEYLQLEKEFGYEL